MAELSGIGSPVTQLLAGSGIALSPAGGVGVQTISNPQGGPDWPAARGLLGWTFPPVNATVGTVPGSGFISLAKLYVPVAGTASTIYVDISTAGATLTAGQSLAGLYNSSGTLLGITADQSAVWTVAGFYAMAMTAQAPGLALAAGSFYYGAIISNGTTPASPRGGPLTHAGLVNAGLSAPNLAGLTFTTGGQTTLPASLNLTNTTAQSQQLWFAVS